LKKKINKSSFDKILSRFRDIHEARFRANLNQVLLWAKKWMHICSEKGLSYGAAGNSLVEKVKGEGDESVVSVLSAVYDEYL
jgi:hypothetical protein